MKLNDEYLKETYLGYAFPTIRFEAVFEVPAGLVPGTPEFEDFLAECASSDDMTAQNFLGYELTEIKEDEESDWEDANNI